MKAAFLALSLLAATEAPVLPQTDTSITITPEQRDAIVKLLTKDQTLIDDLTKQLHDLNEKLGCA